jgi:hypothetical protein
MCDNCRRGPATQPFDGTSRAIAASARKMAPADFAEWTLDKHEHLDQISIILKRIISSSIGREVVGEVSLAINN